MLNIRRKKSIKNTAEKIILSSIWQSFTSGDIRMNSIWNKTIQLTKQQLKNKKTQRDLGMFAFYKIKQYISH